jgi:hypothetical protein
VLALGLGLVVTEVCILLAIRCFHVPLLYSEGLVVLRDHTNIVCGMAATMYQREQGLWPFGQKLDSEDGGERSGRDHLRDPLAHGERPEGYPWSYSTEILALARGSSEN